MFFGNPAIWQSDILVARADAGCQVARSNGEAALLFVHNRQSNSKPKRKGDYLVAYAETGLGLTWLAIFLCARGRRARSIRNRNQLPASAAPLSCTVGWRCILAACLPRQARRPSSRRLAALLYWLLPFGLHIKARMTQKLAGLLDTLRGAASYQTLLSEFTACSGRAELNIARSARPFLLAALAKDWQGPLIYVTAAVRRAYNVCEQLPLWLEEPGRVYRFAEPSADFYDRAPWEPSVIHNRIAALSALAYPRTGSSRSWWHPPAPCCRRLCRLTTFVGSRWSSVKASGTTWKASYCDGSAWVMSRRL